MVSRSPNKDNCAIWPVMAINSLQLDSELINHNTVSTVGTITVTVTVAITFGTLTV